MQQNIVVLTLVNLRTGASEMVTIPRVAVLPHVLRFIQREHLCTRDMTYSTLGAE